jgi:hypothetical protein
MTTAFVLGNGRSRLAINVHELSTVGAVYACNAMYREFVPQVLVATDRPIAEAIQHLGYSQNHVFYTRRPIPGMGARRLPQDWYGFSSGPAAVALAAQAGYHEVYLLGFDLGGLPGDRFNNVYADTEFYKRSSARATYSGNWIRQLRSVFRQFATTKFSRVHGDTTADVAEFHCDTNYAAVPVAEFLAKINILKERWYF